VEIYSLWWSGNTLSFTEPGTSFPFSEEPFTDLYPDSDKSNSYPHTLFLSLLKPSGNFTYDQV
jgi:hypothetical protein